jgi:hypothetical protein
MRKFQVSAGITEGNAPTLHDRLFTAARKEGFVISDAKGRERCSVSVPSAVSLSESYDRPTNNSAPGWIYRFLSGYSHGLEWAAVRGAELFTSKQDGADLNMVRVDMEELLFFANRTVSVVARAVALHVNYRSEPSRTR